MHRTLSASVKAEEYFTSNDKLLTFANLRMGYGFYSQLSRLDYNNTGWSLWDVGGTAKTEKASVPRDLIF